LFTFLIARSWDSYLACPRANIRKNPNDIKKKEKKEETQQEKRARESRLNVVIWGQDSLSRNTFIRKLPITFKYLQEKLDGIILKGYNIVGDGTPQALIPILTGQTELELPETRKRKEKESTAQFVNVYPFIWKEYQAQGYLTGTKVLINYFKWKIPSH
jgi:hypothetical protein